MTINLLSTNATVNSKGILLCQKGDYFIFEVEAETDDYYLFDIGYEHNDWEAFHQVTVTYPTGESVKGLQGFQHGRTRGEILLYLKKGKNKIQFNHHFCLPIQIRYVKCRGRADCIPYELSPCNILFFRETPKRIQTFLKNYRQRIIKIETEAGIALSFRTKDKGDDEYRRSMQYVFLEKEEILKLENGTHTLGYHLANGTVLYQKLEICQDVQKTDFKYINLNVGHGNSTLLFLPNGKKLLIDSADEDCARNKVIPFLEKHSIKIDYYLLTHRHPDHDGLMEEILETHGITKPPAEKVSTLMTANKNKRYAYLTQFSYLDSSMLCCYDNLHDIWDLGGVQAEILNSRYDENGEPVEMYNYPFIENNEHNYENATSVAIMFDYNGFHCYHGADNYAYSQERYLSDMIKAKRTKELACHWFYANHHFVCDISPTFINTLNPVGVYITNGNIYYRHTYKTTYKQDVEAYYFASKRLSDTLIADEVGTAVVNINSADDWYYETFSDDDFFMSSVTGDSPVCD